MFHVKHFHCETGISIINITLCSVSLILKEPKNKEIISFTTFTSLLSIKSISFSVKEETIFNIIFYDELSI